MNRNELLSIAKPILFNTEMVKAILDGRKTVTRRVVKPHYKDDEIGFNVVTNAHDGSFVRIEKYDEYENTFDEKGNERIVTPPYNVGDILYVRETWNTYCQNGEEYYIYKTHDRNRKILEEVGNVLPKWRPSIHMPKEAARIFLRVTNVRAEKLQSILMSDMRSEGVIPDTVTGGTYEQWQHDYFKPIWDGTIKKADRDKYGWDANPWVWVIKFEKAEVEE